MPDASLPELPTPTSLRELAIAAFAFTLLYVAFFAPVLFGGRLLSPGDALVYSVPSFYAPPTLWSDSLYCGYAAAADPQIQTWYPLRLLFALLGSWNALAVSAYVVASTLTFGYVRELTGSRTAGAVGGLVYGMSGTLMAHLGHTAIVHAAVWLPLLVWALERLRTRPSIGGIAMGAVAIGMSALAGQPQVLVYSLATGGLYALLLARSAASGALRFLTSALAMVGIGLGLGAIQLLPTIELVGESPRAHMTFRAFVEYALPVDQLGMLLLPALFGSGGGAVFHHRRYFGLWNEAEVAGYVGLLTLILAGVALARGRPRRIIGVWAVIGLVSLLLALGAATPLAWIVFQVPGFNKLRDPGRHLFEMAFAAAVLAGIGCEAIERRRATRATVLAASAVLGVLVLLAIGIATAPRSALQLRARPAVSLSPLANPAVGVPCLVLLLGTGAATLFASTSRRPRAARAILLGALFLDLGSYSWLTEWHGASPRREAFATPDHAPRYAARLRARRERMLPADGDRAPISELPANQSRLWGVPSAVGYGPFLSARYAQLLDMAPTGRVSGLWSLPESRALDLLGVRYVFVDEERVPRWTRIACLDGAARAADLSLGLPVAAEDIAEDLGRGCGVVVPNRLELRLPVALAATRIAVVTSLVCGHHLPQGNTVAQVSVFDDGGIRATVPLHAGIETAEGRFECAREHLALKHERAPVFDATTATTDTDGWTCRDERFLGVLDLPDRIAVREIAIEVPSRRALRLHVDHVTLLDDARGEALPLSVTRPSTPEFPWRHVEDIGRTRVLERTTLLPRAWLAHAAVVLEPAEMVAAIRSAQLPDGRTFVPERTTLLDAPLDRPLASADGRGDGGEAELVTEDAGKLGAARLVYRTRSEHEALLVTREPYHPGWVARVDGRRERVIRADGVLRAVAVPAGEHEVELRFAPASFAVGASVSALSALVLAGATLAASRTRSRPSGLV